MSLVDTIISSCCDAFIIFTGTSAECSACGAQQYTISKDPLPIDIKYNPSMTNITSESTKRFESILKRFSTDETCEICTRRCEKCNSYMRYLRNPVGKIVFVCSNGKCRKTEI
jgi:hypothetical protein